MSAVRSAVRDHLPPWDWIDYLVSQCLYFRSHGRFGRAAAPRSFSDHLFRIKTRELHDPLRVFVSDKEYVKWYVGSRVGDEHNVTTLAVLKTPQEVDAMTWPERCVIKPAHSSRDVILKHDGSTAVDTGRIKSWLGKSYYLSTREANYRHLERKVIVEPFVDFGQDKPPPDYKLFCFFGEPKIIQVDLDRFEGQKRVWYTADWGRLPFATKLAPGPDVARPGNLEALLALARVLSEPFASIRVDTYTDGENILVGELTNVHGSALEAFKPDPSYDTKLGPIFEDPDFDPRTLM